MLDFSPTPSSLPPVTSMQGVIDQTLQVIASESRRIEDHLGLVRLPVPTLEQLRAGALGKDLTRLALVADGDIREAQDQVVTAIDTVLQVLFWPAGSEEYSVPRAFWSSDLGRMLARAKFRAFAAQDLVGIAVAADLLGVSRPTVYRVYRWMEDRSLDYVHDEISGRSYVLRHGIIQRLQVAADMQA